MTRSNTVLLKTILGIYLGLSSSLITAKEIIIKKAQISFIDNTYKITLNIQHSNYAIDNKRASIKAKQALIQHLKQSNPTLQTISIKHFELSHIKKLTHSRIYTYLVLQKNIIKHY